jgi:predicted nucleic acid-binding protein
MAALIAFDDANVLYPAELRNFLMHLALTGLFRAKWSASVHEEWISSLLKNRPDLTREKLERTRQLMDKASLDALVEGYEDLIPGLSLPDENDRHVFAAAIRGGAQVIVTMNLKDFPSEVLQQYEMEALHPDDFILQLIELAPDVVLDAAETHRLSLKNPPKLIDEFLASLEAQGLPRSVAALRMLFRPSTDIVGWSAGFRSSASTCGPFAAGPPAAGGSAHGLVAS